ncbi:MAG TPA: hypothetical protein VHM91_16190 [Verrucomicrobiales bacterium]|nr:hypothetical protein [Verrucomicrobiales bacterium]
MNRKRPSHTGPAVLLAVIIGITAAGIWALLENRSRMMERVEGIFISRHMSGEIKQLKDEGSPGTAGAVSFSVEAQAIVVAGTLESTAQLQTLKDRISANHLIRRPVFYEVAIVAPDGKAKWK